MIYNDVRERDFDFIYVVYAEKSAYRAFNRDGGVKIYKALHVISDSHSTLTRLLDKIPV